MNFMPSPATMPSEGLQIQEDREELCQGTDIQYAHPYGSCRHLLRQATCKKGRPCARPWRTMPIPTRSGGSWAGQRRRPGPGLSSISAPGHASAPAGSTAGSPRGGVKIIGQQTGYERPLLFVCFRPSYPIQQRGYAFYKARLMRRMGAAQPSSAWGSRHNNQQDGTRPGLRAMLVICEECAQKYKVDERQMRGDRARFTCQKCGHPVIVRREDAAPGRPHGESRIPIVETSY